MDAKIKKELQNLARGWLTAAQCNREDGKASVADAQEFCGNALLAALEKAR